jgi:Zn-dependent peptidase ImmA (M78 family)
MRRGFKAEAERIASRVREEMGQPVDAALDPFLIAAHVGVQVVPADRLVSLADLRRLADIQPDAWSAASFKKPTGQVVIVINPLSSEGRRNSDLAHEVAHLLLNHKTSSVERVGPVAFFTCDAAQEEEANWLAGCLLLPRPVLLRAARAGTTPEALAEQCAVSVPMARFRLNASGVLIQVGHARRKASS